MLVDKHVKLLDFLKRPSYTEVVQRTFEAYDRFSLNSCRRTPDRYARTVGGRLIPMNPAIILRIAAVLAAIQGIGHGGLFLSAKPRYGAAEIAVIEAMKSNRFFAGATRSYWDYYFGYGLLAAAACFVQAVLLWQLAKIAESNASLVRPIVGLLILANVGHALLVARYFMFVLPIAFDLLITACLAWAFVAAGHVSRS